MFPDLGSGQREPSAEGRLDDEIRQSGKGKEKNKKKQKKQQQTACLGERRKMVYFVPQSWGNTKSSGHDVVVVKHDMHFPISISPLHLKITCCGAVTWIWINDNVSMTHHHHHQQLTVNAEMPLSADYGCAPSFVSKADNIVLFILQKPD